MLSVVRMQLKGAVGGLALNCHGNFMLAIENHGILFLNFCGNPAVNLWHLCNTCSYTRVGPPVPGDNPLFHTTYISLDIGSAVAQW